MSQPAFATTEGLRLLLLDLAYAGRRAWQTSPEAAELMTYTMDKYAGLAHKYGMEPTDAAAAAFEVMRMRSTRVADDPWAVVTHAVELTLIYESRAEGLLCSTGQARKTAGLDYHDAARFADRDSEIADYHPAFHFCAKMADPYATKPAEPEDEPTNAFFALADAVRFFEELRWPERDARLGLEYIAARLDRCGKCDEKRIDHREVARLYRTRTDTEPAAPKGKYLEVARGLAEEVEWNLHNGWRPHRTFSDAGS